MAAKKAKKRTKTVSKRRAATTGGTLKKTKKKGYPQKTGTTGPLPIKGQCPSVAPTYVPGELDEDDEIKCTKPAGHRGDHFNKRVKEGWPEDESKGLGSKRRRKVRRKTRRKVKRKLHGDVKRKTRSKAKRK